MKSQRGETTVLLLALVALAALGFVAWPKFFHGDTKRAEKSAEATLAVNTTTDALVEVERLRAATAAASVVKIGEANTESPDSPSKNFVAREVPVALANLPAPDPHALLAAEKRKVAVMEGRVAESAALYRAALGRAEQLVSERDEARHALDLARIERAQVDSELAEVAAARRAAEQQKRLFIIFAAVAAGLWLWAKLTHFSPWQQAKAVADLRSGTYADPVDAIDVAASPLQQFVVRFFVRLRKIFTQ